jgi:hypothetical protein
MVRLWNHWHRIEPTGSAPTMRTLGFFSLRYRAVPEIVPPVPIEVTNVVIRPAVCSHNSGPVVL